MPRRVEVRVVAAAHLRAPAAAVAVRLHRVECASAFGQSARKLEKFETPELAAVLAGGGTSRVVAWDQTFTFTSDIGRPEELVATFKVSQGGQALGEASVTLDGLGDSRPRESWLPLRRSDTESDVALDKGFLRVVLLYVATPRVEVRVREGDGYFGAEGDAAFVDVKAIGLAEPQGTPRVDSGATMVERLDSEFRTRSVGGLPTPQWEQTFVVAELADARLVLEFEGTCGQCSLGKARLSFEDLPAEARCDATVTCEGGAETAVALRLRTGNVPDMVGLAAQDFLEAIDDLSDDEVTETLRELGSEMPLDATANARRQRLRLLYGPRELRLSVRRVVTEDGQLPILAHTTATTPLCQLQAPAHQQRDVCGIFVCERLAPIIDHHHGVVYAVMKRTALRPDFVEEEPATSGGFVRRTATSYVEQGTTARVTQVRLGRDGRVQCYVVGKSLYSQVRGSPGTIEGWAAAEDERGVVCLRPISGTMFTAVEMHLNGSTVTVQPALSSTCTSAAVLKLRLDQLYAWESTTDGRGFCFRLSEGDIDAGLVDRASFRMRGSEGRELMRLLDSTIRRHRDAAARYAGSQFCTSALAPARVMSVPVNPLRRDFTVGFAVVVKPSQIAAPIVELLQQAMYTVTSIDNLASAVELLRSSVSSADGARGLLVVQHNCNETVGGGDGFGDLVALSHAGKLPESVAVVTVLPDGSVAETIRTELRHSLGNRLEVLVEPVQTAEVAQLCWLLPPPQVQLPPGVQRSASTPLARQLTASKVTGEWKAGLASSQQLRDKLTKPLQRAVGGKKTRYVDKENNLDLNLCYITKTCIAMGLPADATEGLIRNNIKEVARFFDLKHPEGTFKIFNLCIERTYDCSYFRDQVGWFPCPDHNVPPLHMLHNLAMSAHRFLQSDDRNVIAMHCKGGKGRTGTAVCAHLVQHWKLSAAQALLAYENARTTGWSVGSSEGSQGVTGASQIRYVHYYERILREGRERELDLPPTRRLTSIRLENPPSVPASEAGQLFVWCKAECNYRELFRTVAQPLSVDGAMLVLAQFQRSMFVGTIHRVVELAGDVFFSFFLHRAKRSTAAAAKAAASEETDELLAEVWIHTSFAGDGADAGGATTTTLRRDELDIKLKSIPIPGDIAIAFDFGDAEGRPAANGAGAVANAAALGLPAAVHCLERKFFHVAPDGHRVEYSPEDCRAIATARWQGRDAVRLSDVILPNGQKLQFEVRFGANALSRRWTEESWVRMASTSDGGHIQVAQRMLQVNLGNENTRLVVADAVREQMDEPAQGQLPAPAVVAMEPEFDF